MISHPSSDVVLDELGDKFVEAIALAVAGARSDLAAYRASSPKFVAESSKRGLANWIHDRLWAHSLLLFEGLDEVDLFDQEPYREIVVGLNYKLRFKRHHADDRVSTFLTQGALDFLGQRGQQLAFTGLEQVNLIAGYRWLDESFEIGAPVLSLRNELEHVLWIVDLDDAVPSGEVGRMPSQPGPIPPVLEARGPQGDDVESGQLDRR